MKNNENKLWAKKGKSFYIELSGIGTKKLQTFKWKSLSAAEVAQEPYSVEDKRAWPEYTGLPDGCLVGGVISKEDNQ